MVPRVRINSIYRQKSFLINIVHVQCLITNCSASLRLFTYIFYPGSLYGWSKPRSSTRVVPFSIIQKKKGTKPPKQNEKTNSNLCFFFYTNSFSWNWFILPSTQETISSVSYFAVKHFTEFKECCFTKSLLNAAPGTKEKYPDQLSQLKNKSYQKCSEHPWSSKHD